MKECPKCDSKIIQDKPEISKEFGATHYHCINKDCLLHIGFLVGGSCPDYIE